MNYIDISKLHVTSHLIDRLVGRTEKSNVLYKLVTFLNWGLEVRIQSCYQNSSLEICTGYVPSYYFASQKMGSLIIDINIPNKEVYIPTFINRRGGWYFTKEAIRVTSNTVISLERPYWAPNFGSSSKTYLDRKSRLKYLIKFLQYLIR